MRASSLFAMVAVVVATVSATSVAASPINYEMDLLGPELPHEAQAPNCHSDDDCGGGGGDFGRWI
ncbi:hypothetical protein OIDMADRAFT_62096 [Oidiodendron maius Zn]|uniref:Uncharacterized protein n=1 Tax=Oidiodendron maius (strain Zn) TaxID=913774 RepID=A0A0C3CTF8_OIDMZ|nr:hypothetical protein OIDMADRAFT_62096 [Oidiodendron maius Zn]